MSISSYLENNDTFEKDYQAVYKTIAKFLFSHSELSFTFSFLGDQFAYIKKRHPEFFVLLKEMSSRMAMLSQPFVLPLCMAVLNSR